MKHGLLGAATEIVGMPVRELIAVDRVNLMEPYTRARKGVCMKSALERTINHVPPRTPMKRSSSQPQLQHLAPCARRPGRLQSWDHWPRPQVTSSLGAPPAVSAMGAYKDATDAHNLATNDRPSTHAPGSSPARIRPIRRAAPTFRSDTAGDLARRLLNGAAGLQSCAETMPSLGVNELRSRARRGAGRAAKCGDSAGSMATRLRRESAHAAARWARTRRSLCPDEPRRMSAR